VVTWLERDADLHMAQLMPLPLTVSCFSKIQIGFTFLVSAHPGCPGKRAVKWVCVLTNGQQLVTEMELLDIELVFLPFAAIVLSANEWKCRNFRSCSQQLRK